MRIAPIVTALLVALALVALAPPVEVQAQTVEKSINLAALGAVSNPELVETDGNLATVEWLIRHNDGANVRIIAERNGGYCMGPWFAPRTSLWQTMTVQRQGVLSKLVLWAANGVLTVVGLTTPTC